MVGTLGQKNQKWALVLAPDNLIYRVAVGNYLGKHYGKILEINKEGLNISEVVPDRRGGWQKRTANLPLQTKDAS